MPAASRRRTGPEEPVPRPHIPLRRLIALTVLTAAFALGLQAALVTADAPGAAALVLLLVPIAAAAAVFVGLRPYPATGRARLAAMVATGLFLIGLGLQ